MLVWIYLKSIALLLQADDVLLQGAAGFLLLFQRRPKLLLQSMALSRHLAHLNLDTQTQAHAASVQLRVFKMYEKWKRRGGFLLPWTFLAADGYPQALLSGRPVAPGGNFPARRYVHMTYVEKTIRTQPTCLGPKCLTLKGSYAAYNQK